MAMADMRRHKFRDLPFLSCPRSQRHKAVYVFPLLAVNTSYLTVYYTVQFSLSGKGAKRMHAGQREGRGKSFILADLCVIESVSPWPNYTPLSLSIPASACVQK